MEPFATLEVKLESKPKLLIVDDQPINIQVLHQAFAGGLHRLPCKV